MDFDPEFIQRFMKPQDIPAALHSAYEEGPFKSCTVCKGVLDDGRLYEVQKVYQGDETIFEMAVCHHCGENVVSEYSEESIENVKNFLAENFRPDAESNHCHFCGFPKNLITRFTIVGACKESSLILPCIIMCENCTERMQEVISKKTRDTQGDFIRDNFPGVPADLDLSPSFSGLLG